MSRPVNAKSSVRPRVLIAAHVGRPFSGISTVYEALLASSLKDRIDLHFIEISQGSLDVTQRGKWRLTNFINAAWNVVRFVGAMIRVCPAVVDIASAFGASWAKASLMIVLARVFGARVVLSPHFSLERLPQGRDLWARYTRFILRRCQGVLALSQEWLQLKADLPKCDIRCIPNAIDSRLYVDMPRPRPDAHAVQILYLGHIGKEKGTFDLIEAAHRLRGESNHFVIDLVGEGLGVGDVALATEMIKTSNLDEVVRIFPPEYGAQKYGRLAASDICALPSYHEGMPMFMLEGLAAGLPVVATRVGGIPDVVQDEATGILIEAGQPQQLANALSQLINDAGMRLQMGLAGREYVRKHHDVEMRVEPLVEFYQSVASRRVENC